MLVDSSEPKKKISKNQIDELYNAGYKLRETIGEGTYSKVKIAEQLTLKGNLFACKIINLKNVNQKFKRTFLPREISISQKLNHPNIVKVYEILEIDHYVYIFMEYCTYGDLLEYIKLHGPLSENLARYYFKQIISAMTYLHRLNIAHRDLKCENILLSSRNTLKLTDFGFSRYCNDRHGNSILSNTFCGSASYVPPEVIENRSYNPKACDIWSMGCILYAMVSNKQPFRDENLLVLVKEQKNQLFMQNDSFRKCSILLKKFFLMMLDPNPNQRGTVRDLSQADWLKVRSTF